MIIFQQKTINLFWTDDAICEWCRGLIKLFWTKIWVLSAYKTKLSMFLIKLFCNATDEKPLVYGTLKIDYHEERFFISS